MDKTTSLGLSLKNDATWIEPRSVHLEDLIIKPTSIMEMKASDQDSHVGATLFYLLTTDRHIIGILLVYPFWIHSEPDLVLGPHPKFLPC